MIIITVIIIIIGIVLSINDFNQNEVKVAVKKVLASIIVAIAANIIWNGVSPFLYQENNQIDEQFSSGYEDKPQNSDDAQCFDGLKINDIQDATEALHKDDVSENDDLQDTTEELYKDDVSEEDEALDNSGSSNTSENDIQTMPKLQVYNIADSEKNTYDNPAIAKNEVNNIDVSFLDYSDVISESGQENSYEFIAPENGIYRCELADMISGFTVSVYLYDTNGSKINSNINISNGLGITVKLSAGDLYRLVVKSSTGTGSYRLFVGQQKEIINISNCTTVNDSIEFVGQENKYLYTPTVTGIHRFWISQINSGVWVSVYVYDDAGYKVGSITDIGIDSGVSVTLTAGQSYSVIIKYSKGYDNYALSIGPQKTTLDISAYTAITDSTEFYNQTNNYLYTASVSGKHRFQIDQINSGIRVSMYVYDAAGYKLNYITDIGQNSGVTVTLNKGETYLIVIKQSNGYNSYTMSIGSPKEVVDISGYDVVNDGIQFFDQENIYTYTPEVSGSYKLSIGNVVSGVIISVYIFDDADYRVNYATGMSNASCFYGYLEANRTYVIKVIQNYNYGSYSLTIDLESK